MDIYTYVEEAKKTESIKQPLKELVVEDTGLTNRMLHSIMGIVTESTEIMAAARANDRVNFLEECGDTFWYLAILADELDIVSELENIDDFEPAVKERTDLLDVCKKALFYGSKVNLDVFKLETIKMYKGICSSVEINGGDVETVQLTNIKKLKARYPDKFTDRDAENRDLTKEREILEDGLN